MGIYMTRKKKKMKKNIYIYIHVYMYICIHVYTGGVTTAWLGLAVFHTGINQPLGLSDSTSKKTHTKYNNTCAGRNCTCVCVFLRCGYGEIKGLHRCVVNGHVHD